MNHPEALRLAEALESECSPHLYISQAATELRRLHAQTAAHQPLDKQLGGMFGESPPIEPVQTSPTREDLIAGLEFYAKGHHFILSDGNAWDTTSGEPKNYWCDEEGTATIEDGSVAKMVLNGEWIAADLADDDADEVLAP